MIIYNRDNNTPVIQMKDYFNTHYNREKKICKFSNIWKSLLIKYFQTNIGVQEQWTFVN